jgi:hypothetical protein
MEYMLNSTFLPQAMEKRFLMVIVKHYTIYLPQNFKDHIMALSTTPLIFIT